MQTMRTGPLTAYDGAGDASTPAEATGLVTLDVDTHYFPLSFTDGAEHIQAHILTDATIAGTFTVETCAFPRYRTGASNGAYDVSDFNEVSGNWVKVNVAAAGYSEGVGTGWTVTVLTLAKTAGAGGAYIHLPNACGARYRIAAAITTPGAVRVDAAGKL